MVLKEKGFSKKNIEKYNEVISDTVLSTVRKIPLGFVMHFIEIYMEELAKVLYCPIAIRQISNKIIV